MDLRGYLKLKEESESLIERAAQAEGALGQLMSQLKDEFGISSLKEAKKLEASLTNEKEQIEKSCWDAEKKWRDKWGDKL